MSFTRRSIGAAVAVGLAAALIPAAASAGQVTGGKTVLHPDQATFEGFADMSISVGATGAAVDGHRGVKFPITGGDVTDAPKGSIEHKGGLVFSRNTAESGVVKFTKFTVKISASGKAKLFAKSDHSEVRFIDLDLTDADVTATPGTKLRIKNAAATLAKQGAAVLTDVFDFPFRKGIPIGLVTIKATLSS